jgi:hypothetical protein
MGKRTVVATLRGCELLSASEAGADAEACTSSFAGTRGRGTHVKASATKPNIVAISRLQGLGKVGGEQ